MASEMLKDSSGLDETAKAILNGVIGASPVQNKKPAQILTFFEISDSICQNNNLDDYIIIDARAWRANDHLGLENLKKTNEKTILEAQIKLREDELSTTMVHFTKNTKTIKKTIKNLNTSLAKKGYGALEKVKDSLKDYQKSSLTVSPC